MKKAGYCICSLLVFLLITQYSIPSAIAQPSLVSANGIYWTVTSEPGYVIYYCESTDRILSSRQFDIENVTDSISFGWKLMAKNPGFLGNIEFTINGTEVSKLIDNNTNYKDVGPIPLKSTDKPAFDITFKKGDKIWIRFPVTTPSQQLSSNQPPTIRSLSPDKMSPQATDVTVVWNVDASDPDGDTILYNYFLNGVEKSGWTESSAWSWKTSEGRIGSNTVEVRIRDGRHANESYYDDRAQGEFQVFVVAPESNITPELRGCVREFNVSTCQEFTDALNNSTNCIKIINLRYMRYPGSFLIKDNKNDLTIKSHPDNRHTPILDGNGGDFVIAIEDSTKVSIDGLQIQNAGVSIYLEDVSDSNITNCKVKDFVVDGISLNNTMKTRIQDNDIDSSTSGVHKTGINLNACNGECEIIDNNIRIPDGMSKNISYDILLMNSTGNEFIIRPPNDGYWIQQGRNSWLVKCDECNACCKIMPESDCDCDDDYAFQSINNWTITCEDAR